MILEYIFRSTNGGVRYLIVNEDKKALSTDYYLNNGGHRPCEQVQLKELKRLYNYYIELGYETNYNYYED